MQVIGTVMTVTDYMTAGYHGLPICASQEYLFAGNLLPNHLDTELDQQLANMAACSLFQFLFFLLEDLEIKSHIRKSAVNSHQDGDFPATQAFKYHDSEDSIIADCSLADINVQHKGDIKALIGMLKPSGPFCTLSDDTVSAYDSEQTNGIYHLAKCWTEYTVAR